MELPTFFNDVNPLPTEAGDLNSFIKNAANPKSRRTVAFTALPQLGPGMATAVTTPGYDLTRLDATTSSEFADEDDEFDKMLSSGAFNKSMNDDMYGVI